MKKIIKKSVLLDFGNVLVGIDFKKSIHKIAVLSGLTDKNIKNIIFDSGLKDAFGRGEISANSFRGTIYKYAKTKIKNDAFDKAWCAMFYDFPQTNNILKKLTKRHNLYLLSNTDSIHIKYIKKKYGFWLKFFKGFYLSFERGKTKPSPAYFKGVLKTFNLKKSDCVYFDDLKENIKSAGNLGIVSFQVKPKGLTKSILKKAGLWYY